ncbi:MAG: hypothetical protein CLLPBCKN_007427 [Chroococcidiopsis cubana SAG 39.79]|nr:hypothetical protein [Chroococcidiopsis cubana SAG 39.79]PSB62287.1 hypothetical protein C7B79_18685 [Chroococcidiopsis cubana CCALA 043]
MQALAGDCRINDTVERWQTNFTIVTKSFFPSAPMQLLMRAGYGKHFCSIVIYTKSASGEHLEK